MEEDIEEYRKKKQQYLKVHIVDKNYDPKEFS